MNVRNSVFRDGLVLESKLFGSVFTVMVHLIFSPLWMIHNNSFFSCHIIVRILSTNGADGEHQQCGRL
nr:hypothetical protein [uncultured Prevotella sp.]